LQNRGLYADDDRLKGEASHAGFGRRKEIEKVARYPPRRFARRSFNEVKVGVVGQAREEQIVGEELARMLSAPMKRGGQQ
jgi:hypothetical protein